jgi:hypothetical protein
MTDDQVKKTPTASDSVADDAAAVSGTGAAASPRPDREGVWSQVGKLIRRIRDGDDAMVEAIVVQLSRRPWPCSSMACG